MSRPDGRRRVDAGGEQHLNRQQLADIVQQLARLQLVLQAADDLPQAAGDRRRVVVCRQQPMQGVEAACEARPDRHPSLTRLLAEPWEEEEE